MKKKLCRFLRPIICTLLTALMMFPVTAFAVENDTAVVSAAETEIKTITLTGGSVPVAGAVAGENWAIVEEDDSPFGYFEWWDLNHDHTVAVDDACFIQRHIAKIAIPFTFFDKVADADGDGSATLMDVTELQKWLATGDFYNSDIGTMLRYLSRS